MATNGSSTTVDETDLEMLPTTDSGAVRKQDAMQWMEDLGVPSDNALKESVVPKSADHSGSTYPEPISNIRITGDPEFITEVAKLFRWFLDFEDDDTRLSLNLQQTEDRETGELTGNYALYLSVVERG